MAWSGLPTMTLVDKASSLELAGEKMSDSEILRRLLGYLWPPGEGDRRTMKGVKTIKYSV